MTPNGNASVYSINSSMNKILNAAVESKLKSITFTGLGTGCCCLDKKIIATNMMDNAKKYCGLLTINIVDLDKQTIEAFNESLYKD